MHPSRFHPGTGRESNARLGAEASLARRDSPRWRFQDVTATERILYVQDLWDRIAAEPGDAPVSDAQRDELDRRLARHAAGEGRTSDWADVRDRLTRS
jgi:putative addiction module component (TIGR02574 family)